MDEIDRRGGGAGGRRGSKNRSLGNYRFSRMHTNFSIVLKYQLSRMVGLDSLERGRG